MKLNNFDNLSEFTVCKFEERFISDVAKTESENFSEPWSENSLRLLCSEEYPSFAVLKGDELAGYIGCSKVLDEVQILTVAVKEKFRGQGVGKLLILTVDRLCESLDIDNVSLEVRKSNFAAVGLYKRCGFRQTGVRKNFYRYPTEDALVMVKKYKNQKTGSTET